LDQRAPRVAMNDWMSLGVFERLGSPSSVTDSAEDVVPWDPDRAIRFQII